LFTSTGKLILLQGVTKIILIREFTAQHFIDFRDARTVLIKWSTVVFLLCITL